VSGVAIEQFHPEAGANQFEISLTTANRRSAAVDQLMLTRIIGGPHRQGGTALRVSLSPAPFRRRLSDAVAHQHFSLTNLEPGRLFLRRGGKPRYDEPGVKSAIAGLLQGLPAAQGMLCGSDRVRVCDCSRAIGRRLRLPGAPRIEKQPCASSFGGPGKPVTAATSRSGPSIRRPTHISRTRPPSWALALDGITQKGGVCPPETKVDPAALSDAEAQSRGALPDWSTSQAHTIAALDNSQRAAQHSRRSGRRPSWWRSGVSSMSITPI